MVYWCSNTLQNYDIFFRHPNFQMIFFEKSGNKVKLSPINSYICL